MCVGRGEHVGMELIPARGINIWMYIYKYVCARMYQALEHYIFVVTIKYATVATML